MPFKESPEGQTHYQNDGCGEPAHNDGMENTKGESWEKRARDFAIKAALNSEDTDRLFDLVRISLSKEKARIREEVGKMKIEPESAFNETGNPKMYAGGYNKCLEDIKEIIK